MPFIKITADNLVLMGVHRNFSRGSNANILLVLFRLLTIQRRRMLTKRFTISTPQHHKKCPCYGSSNKTALRWQP